MTPEWTYNQLRANFLLMPVSKEVHRLIVGIINKCELAGMTVPECCETLRNQMDDTQPEPKPLSPQRKLVAMAMSQYPETELKTLQESVWEKDSEVKVQDGAFHLSLKELEMN